MQLLLMPNLSKEGVHTCVNRLTAMRFREPVAFLIIKEGTVRVMPVAVPAVTTVDRIVEMVPDVVDKVSGIIKKKVEEPEMV